MYGVPRAVVVCGWGFRLLHVGQFLRATVWHQVEMPPRRMASWCSVVSHVLVWMFVCCLVCSKSSLSLHCLLCIAAATLKMRCNSGTIAMTQWPAVKNTLFAYAFSFFSHSFLTLHVEPFGFPPRLHNLCRFGDELYPETCMPHAMLCSHRRGSKGLGRCLDFLHFDQFLCI